MASRLRIVPLLALLAMGCGTPPATGAQEPPRIGPGSGEPAGGDAEWRSAAEARIEQHRKADLRVTVIGADGQPVPDAAVTVEMKRHSFDFGALAGSSRWEDRPTAEDARRHRGVFDDYFNTVVAIVRPWSQSHDALLTWMTERDIDVRGHYLMWAPLQPHRGRGGQPPEAFDGVPAGQMADRADELDREKIRQAVFARIDSLFAFTDGRVKEWDAVNHIANSNHFRYSDLFGAQIYADVINRGRELDPGAQMWVNEGNVLTRGLRLERYHAVIEELIDLGTPPDGIGFMAHFRQGGFTEPEEVYRRLDRFARLVPNLKLTELDIETDDEQLQAEYMADILTVAFSHPAMAGIILWQTWGSSDENKALWRDDWSIKPAGAVLLDHMFDRWWTLEDGVTDGAGSYATRGFLGEYEVTVEAGGETRVVRGDLAPGGSTFTVRF